MKTERDVRRVEVAGDTIPEQANVYVPPRPLAALAEHRTMDVKAIRLAAEVDPRQALTELRLYAPPLKKDKTWIAPLLLALLAIGFIGLWWITPSPLPLAPTGAEKEPIASPAAPSKPPLPSPASVTVPERARTSAAPLGPNAAGTPTAARAATPASTAAPVSTAASGPLPSAPHRAKPVRDPWLQ